MAAGPFVLATGVLMTVGALLSRFGVTTFFSPSRNDQRPGLLAAGAGLVLAGIGLVTNARGDAFWDSVLSSSAVIAFATALALQVKSWRNRLKNGK